MGRAKGLIDYHLAMMEKPATESKSLKMNFVFVRGDGGIEVSMVAFQAVDPGSIPGHRNSLTYTR
ncbi:hypothetical protein DAPPUDRAFT_274929 [Daphnia pulex]|uniref:Uncharacterized protein n=1 Tax=Daphnia pulex TaxID=6669 RepID=E9I4X9_DAPPU|nr:hypothetical protein DAPPUDRAFT_274929 [Daphnia pulex]|eukprot:EFX60951.1 hypothetical protein DAPPUDRAFT_274929 [Daphnia pulex]